MEYFPNAYISPISLIELEQIKTAYNKDNEIKYKSREAIKNISNSVFLQITDYPQRKIQRILKKSPYLLDINDHKILATAELLGMQEKGVIFITSDKAQYLFAKRLPHISEQLYEDQKIVEEYKGWQDYYPTDTELAALYSDSNINTLNCKTNEFAKIFKDGNLKDILFWNGKNYVPLKYKDIKNPYLNETIKPRNIEQKMAIHLLQNQDIKVKLLTSAWGSGKTLLALSYALEQIHHGNYNKLVFVRNNIIVADTNDIGFLPGNLKEKMSIWGAPLADHLGGQDMLDQLIMDGVIEIYPLSHMRGRSINDSIVICDECENMNDKLITLLMSRIEENSELIFCGDVAQIDNYKFEKNNGIRAMIKHLSGEQLFGMVKLIKSERGKVAQLCDKLRPPI